MNIEDLAKAVFDEIEAEVNISTKWKSTSKYVRIRYLQIDKRGSFGERLIRDIFSKERNISLEYSDGDQGVWDIKINGFSFEIKTSSLDVNNKFQNENIRNTNDCDFICFLGVAPDEIYIRIEKISDIDFSSLHDRRRQGTGAGYKWDFKPSDMQAVKTRQEVVKLFYSKMGLDKSAIKKRVKG